MKKIRPYQLNFSERLEKIVSGEIVEKTETFICKKDGCNCIGKWKGQARLFYKGESTVTEVYH